MGLIALLDRQNLVFNMEFLFNLIQLLFNFQQCICHFFSKAGLVSALVWVAYQIMTMAI
ncbi:MAG: hypothetical protein IPF72_13220 [Chitinophagaceae bacterium]|nr:hypothetical protein [Chitinophagaceae bacterium]